MKHRPELDGVRGVACLLVLSLHCCVGLVTPTPGSTWETVRLHLQPFLFSGVDLFFILSGFLISGILMDGRDRPAYFRTFWTRRFARIFPVYYLVIGLSAVALFVQAQHPTKLGWALTNSALPLWPYVAFVQNFVMAKTGNGGVSMLGITWSLAIEEQFYLVLPALIFFLPRRVIAGGALAIFLATPFVRAFAVLRTADWQGSYFLTFDRLDGLALGIMLAVMVRSIPGLAIAKRNQVGINVLASVLILGQVFDVWDVAANPLEHAAGTYYASLVLRCAQFPLLNFAMAGLMLNLFTASDGWLHRVLRNPVLTWVGLVSYAAYMYHETVNWSAFALIYGTGTAIYGWHQWFMPPLVLGVTFALAAASYRWLEMPIRQWAARATSARRHVLDESAPVHGHVIDGRLGV